MQLLPIPDASGSPIFWINADHLVSVSRLHIQTGRDVRLVAELKIEGMPLHRVELGTFDTIASADSSWTAFLERLQSP